MKTVVIALTVIFVGLLLFALYRVTGEVDAIFFPAFVLVAVATVAVRAYGIGRWW